MIIWNTNTHLYLRWSLPLSTSGSHWITVGSHAEWQAGDPSLNCTGWKTAMKGSPIPSVCSTALLLGLKYGSYPSQGGSLNRVHNGGWANNNTCPDAHTYGILIFLLSRAGNRLKWEWEKITDYANTHIWCFWCLPKCVAVFVSVCCVCVH